MMKTLSTQLLTDETKEVIARNPDAIDFANREEGIYLTAMTNAKTDFVRRDALVAAFNESVISYAYHYCKM